MSKRRPRRAALILAGVAAALALAPMVVIAVDRDGLELDAVSVLAAPVVYSLLPMPLLWTRFGRGAYMILGFLMPWASIVIVLFLWPLYVPAGLAMFATGLIPGAPER